jgi:hypothetical protein
MTDDLLNNDKSKEPSNYLEELVGPGKKYANAEELAKSRWHADAHIKNIESRMDEIRTDHLTLLEKDKTKATLEEMLQEIRSASSTTNPHAKTVDTEKKPNTTQFDPEQIESMLSKKIAEHEANKRRDENFNNVKKELEERFGDKYPEVLSNTIKHLELEPDYVNDLARKSPKAFMKAMGFDQVNNADYSAPPRSTHQTGFKPTGTNKRTWQFYQDLKKSNPTAYWDPKTSTQMMKDAIALGDDFKDGDYHRFRE